MTLLRDLLLFLGGLCVGSLINTAVYGLAFDWRPISPWLPPPDVRRRSWLDCIPLLGWWRLRRESAIHGRWFWIRPILIELAYAAGMVWLFHFETNDGLLPRPLAMIEPVDWYPMFVVHAVLIALITAATFIDFDELTIPDAVTLFGAILILILTTIMPSSHLPTIYNTAFGLGEPEPLLFNSQPADRWPAQLDGWQGLAIALAILWGWWMAIQHGTATLRHGWSKAVSYYLVSLVRLRPRHRPTYRNLLWGQILLFAVLSAATVGVWRLGGDHWKSLFTSLVGLGFAGGLVWAVRIGGYIGLQREAMGFGDATLMTMIGAALGWQAALLIFFVSPFAAVIIAILNALLTRRQHIPFGPYLSLATIVVIVAWVPLWEEWTQRYFVGSPLIPYAVVSFLLLMTGMLWLWRIIKTTILAALFREPAE